MKNNIVFLAHRNEQTKTHCIEYLTCKSCQNKTWIVIYDESGDGFPVMKCACCNTDGGKFRWVNDE